MMIEGRMIEDFTDFEYEVDKASKDGLNQVSITILEARKLIELHDGLLESFAYERHKNRTKE